MTKSIAGYLFSVRSPCMRRELLTGTSETTSRQSAVVRHVMWKTHNFTTASVYEVMWPFLWGNFNHIRKKDTLSIKCGHFGDSDSVHFSAQSVERCGSIEFIWGYNLGFWLTGSSNHRAPLHCSSAPSLSFIIRQSKIIVTLKEWQKRFRSVFTKLIKCTELTLRLQLYFQSKSTKKIKRNNAVFSLNISKRWLQFW